MPDIPSLPSNIGDFVYFALIYTYLQDTIQTTMAHMMARTMQWVSLVSLVMATLWVLLQGYRIVTGQTRESVMEIVMKGARVVVIMTAASTMSVMGHQISPLIVNDTAKVVHELFTGDDNDSLVQSIDKNLAMTQVAMSVIDGVQLVESDHDTRDAKARAMVMVTFGTSSPPMAAAGMLLLFEFAQALCIGLGPLFIMCLLFEQTKELFRGWLLFTIGTLFSMAALALVSAIALDLTLRVAGALWGASFINSMLNTDSEGLSAQALQQGGVGLLMTLLIVSVPPMAASFFKGTMGSFTAYSIFSGGASRLGQGRSLGATGGHSAQITTEQANSAHRAGNNYADSNINLAMRVPSGMTKAPKDEIKPYSPMQRNK